MTHIDEWLDTPSIFNEMEAYAKFVLDYFRMPAWKIIAYSPFMKQFKLFCTHNGQRYRCTGASRMGDIWLTPDFDQETGYKLRVDVSECSDWNDSPNL